MKFDYHNLSPDEFEKLLHDLLEKKLKIRLEQFATGRDGGIDLRCASYRFKDDLLIVQCKRYKSYSELYNSLKSVEINKIKKLNPKRYILATSLDLSPDNKKNIFDLLSPFIISTEDIFIRKDIDSMLEEFPEVEKSHYKLFLTSTTALERLLKSKIYNQTEFEKQEIIETMKKYVQTQSFQQVINILNKENYCIITGVPGIGKTTLAQALLCFYISKGYQAYVVRNIIEAIDIYNEKELQFIYFDDFLGDTTIDMKLKDKEFISFIKVIQKSKNKKFILTSRNYLIEKARQESEVFEREKTLIDNQCILTLSDYTKIQKAKILYNHLYFGNIPIECIDSLKRNKSYNIIIDNPNYNPRIIDQVTSNNYTGIPKDFANYFITILNKPKFLWDIAFNKKLDFASQTLLLLMAILDKSISKQEVFDLFDSYYPRRAKKLNKSLESNAFVSSAKVLEHSFITVKHSKKIIEISLNNPSIKDFLYDFLSENLFELEILLDSCITFDQYFYIIVNFHNFSVKSKSIYIKKLIEMYFHTENYDSFDNNSFDRQDIRTIAFYDFIIKNKEIQLLKEFLLKYVEYIKKHRIINLYVLTELITKLSLNRFDDYETIIIELLDISLDFLPNEYKEITTFLNYIEIIENLREAKIECSAYEEKIKASHEKCVNQIINNCIDNFCANSSRDEIKNASEMLQSLQTSSAFFNQGIGDLEEEISKNIDFATEELAKYEDEYASYHEDDWKEQYYESKSIEREIASLYDSLGEVYKNSK